MNARSVARQIGLALYQSDAIRAYCVEQYGKGCLVRVGDLAAEPISAEQAPALVVSADSDSGQREGGFERVTVSIIAAVDGDMTLSTEYERTEESNGLEVVDLSDGAETLLRLAIDAVTAETFGGGQVTSVSIEQPAFLSTTLNWCAARIEISRPLTLQEDEA